MKVDISPNDPRFCVEFLPSKLTAGEFRIEMFDRSGSSCCEITLSLHKAEELLTLVAAEVVVARAMRAKRQEAEDPHG